MPGLPSAAIFGAPMGSSPFYASGGDTGGGQSSTTAGSGYSLSPPSLQPSLHKQRTAVIISEGPLFAEGLLHDRLAEFQQKARARGALLAPMTPASSGRPFAGSPPGEASSSCFMRQFFDSVSKISDTIQKGRSNVKLMAQVLEDALVATTQDRQAEASERLQELVQDTNGHVADAKAELERLKARSDEEAAKKPNSAESRIRTNMQQAMAKKHQQLLLDFQKAQVDYKKALQQRQYREMEILVPQATEEERARMIEDGETAAVVVARTMAGTHAMLHEEVNRIREKHQDILKLEASIADLAQMFQEAAVLVQEQGEMLDTIELNVHNTQVCTAKANDELRHTRKLQHQHTKFICCSSCCLLIIAILIMAPVLFKG